MAEGTRAQEQRRMDEAIKQLCEQSVKHSNQAEKHSDILLKQAESLDELKQFVLAINVKLDSFAIKTCKSPMEEESSSKPITRNHSMKDSPSIQVYIIGGDGTMRGAVKIFDEIRRRNLKVAVVGIPKTVDNDVGIIDRSFGFQTAVEMSQQAISAAHVEAESAVNGIGLVKLMGRSTGHIALYATLSSRDVDCCLIPENEFFLEGKGGLFEFLDHRLKENGHAVVVVAEGAGQDMIPRSDAQKEERDESGNAVFLDVGSWLKSELKKWWTRDHPNELFTVKYIDPTYMIRAVPPNATDNLYCTLLSHSAIHGVMAGYTGFVSGPINGNYAYIPLEEVAQAKNEVNTRDHKWAWVRSVNSQPDFVKS